MELIKGIISNKFVLLLTVCGVIAYIFYDPYTDHEITSPDGNHTITYLEEVINHSNDDTPIPMAIILHGSGDTPRNFFYYFREIFEESGLPIRIIIPRGTFENPGGRNGYYWYGSAGGIAQSGDNIGKTIESLLSRYPTKGWPIVFGYSQGGLISSYVALQHPEWAASVVSICSILYTTLREDIDDPKLYPNIYSFHGKQDPLISISKVHKAIKLLKEQSINIEAKEYDSGHYLSNQGEQDLITKIREITLTLAEGN